MMRDCMGPYTQEPPEVAPDVVTRARNWGLVCGFGYGFASATFAFIILLFVTAPHA
jgi:hypothetical protein